MGRDTVHVPCLSPGELCQGAGWGVWSWPSTRRDPWLSLWVMPAPLHGHLTHGHAVSSTHPWALAAKLFSPAARFSDASGLGKGSWVIAAVWRARSPTYALFQKLSLTIWEHHPETDPSACLPLCSWLLTWTTLGICGLVWQLLLYPGGDWGSRLRSQAFVCPASLSLATAAVLGVKCIKMGSILGIRLSSFLQHCTLWHTALQSWARELLCTAEWCWIPYGFIMAWHGALGNEKQMMWLWHLL